MSAVLRSYVAPVLLGLLTASYCWYATGLAFTITILLIVGAHAFGHFIVARQNDVACMGPYLAPYNFMAGTCGAFLKMQWPIASRISLARIFLAGPILGIATSILAIVVGLNLSEVITATQDNQMTFEFGDSLLAFLLEKLLLGDLSDQQDVLLSPIGFAGWIGLHLNMIQLLPVGRFDGARLTTALFGFRVSRIVSFVFIGLLLASALIGGAMPYVAMVGAATHVGLREQYEGLSDDPLTLRQALTVAACFLVLLVLVYPFRSPNFGFP